MYRGVDSMNIKTSVIALALVKAGQVLRSTEK